MFWLVMVGCFVWVNCCFWYWILCVILLCRCLRRCWVWVRIISLGLCIWWWMGRIMVFKWLLCLCIIWKVCMFLSCVKIFGKWLVVCFFIFFFGDDGVLCFVKDFFIVWCLKLGGWIWKGLLCMMWNLGCGWRCMSCFVGCEMSCMCCCVGVGCWWL